MKSLLVILFIISSLALTLCFSSCKQHHDNSTSIPFGPKVVEAHGYVVPADSMAPPKIILVDERKLKKVPADKPKMVPASANIQPAGKPNIVIVGKPRICTPGKDTFLLPKTVVAVENTFLAGIPEKVIVQNPAARDKNPGNFSSFGIQQGLNSPLINCLMEDRAGNLWIAAGAAGACRYDGRYFTYFTTEIGLTHNWVSSIVEDLSGNIWFGTWGGGISKYDGRYFTNFTVKEGLTNNDVSDLLEDQSGNLWISTEGGGISKYDGKSFIHFTEKEGLSHNYVWNIMEDRSGNVWFGTKGGACKYDGNSFTHFTEKEGLPSDEKSIILEDHAGNIWFGGMGGGVSKFDGKSFSHFTEKEGLLNNYVGSILEDRSGTIWFGTSRGVSKFDGKSFTQFTEEEGLTNEWVTSSLEDRSGTIWFGSAIEGLFRYNGKSFSHFTNKESLSNSLINNIVEDYSGNLWLGTHGNGVIKYNGQSFLYFTEDEGLLHNEVWDILQDQYGNLWFGTDGGASKFDGQFFTHYTEKDGLCKNDINTLYEDRHGNIWIGTRTGGVSKYDGKAFTNFTTNEGLSHNEVTSILEDQYGMLWFGTYSRGVIRYDPMAKDRTGSESFTHFTEKEGLSNNYVWSIMEDRSGKLWFATNGGLTMYDGKFFTHFTDKEGLSNNEVCSTLEDRNGNLWFGTVNGLNQLLTARLPNFAITEKDSHNRVEWSDPKDTKSFIRSYTFEDGFTGLGCFKRAICQDSKGTIWIGTYDRLTAYHPEGDVPDTIAPNLQLTGISLFNELIPWSEIENHQDSTITLANGVQIKNFRFDGITRMNHLPINLSLAYDNNDLSFHFTGITQKRPKKVKYQYRLEGNDESWSTLTSLQEVHYGNLPHGAYIFKVKAMNSEGYWSNEYHYTFKIRPPWWLTWWAYSLYAFLGISLLWRFHKFQQARTIRMERERTQAKELAQAKEIEKAYNQLETAHENLKAAQKQLIQSEKMASLGELTAGIAHEIQNPLNFVNNFAELNSDLIAEMKQDLDNENLSEAKVIANTIDENEQKIIFHGKRADAIVKGMLQHSRTSTGVKEPTDINALADEYLRLAYHGLRAKDKSFNATIKTDFDPNIGLINVVPQDIGRVILNLITNAFYAVSSLPAPNPSTPKSPEGDFIYQPTVIVTTKRKPPLGGLGAGAEVRVKDNGPGIPDAIKDKIFQPFFTTKPTGQGTGLGLSLSYDIVKAHGGEIKVESSPGSGTEFIIILPQDNTPETSKLKN